MHFHKPKISILLENMRDKTCKDLSSRLQAYLKKKIKIFHFVFIFPIFQIYPLPQPKTLKNNHSVYSAVIECWNQARCKSESKHRFLMLFPSARERVNRGF